VTKTILIVEDEILVAMDIERILLDAGFEVSAIAADRETALRLGQTADIAFVDINLRDGQTGPSIAYDLAERYGTKVFYVTANPAQIVPVASCAVGYIQKPFSDGAIRAAAQLAEADCVVDGPTHPEITLFCV
jgi:DNA-binding response OmpR family regulator